MKTLQSSRSTKIWLVHIILQIIAGILIAIGILLHNIKWEELDSPYCKSCYSYYNYSVEAIDTIIAGCVLMVVSFILRIWSQFVQRRIFLRKQEEMGQFSFYEGRYTSLLLSWLCYPCLFGEINSTLEKQKQLAEII